MLAADFRPVEVCSSEEAIWDVMQGRAEIIESDGVCHSQHLDVEIPSVIRQIRYHKPKHQGKPRSLPLTPRNVCARDRWICAYQVPNLCSGKATTIDHVKPRSKGGENTWENVVAACRNCNHKKGSKTIEELGWRLHNTPWRPTGALARVLVHANNPDWTKYLIKEVDR